MLPLEYILRQTVDQARRSGARGGRTTARNRRLRRPVRLTQPTPPTHLTNGETTANAIVRLDAQFPWLRGAEQRQRRSSAGLPS